MSKRLVRFDWAMKKMLRHKANFDILEGFLSELLRFDITIESILESESNKHDEYDKYNRVDILAKSPSNKLILIEIQQDSEADYFHRMLYGVSKLVTEYIKEGEPYGVIKKIYSINIVYFGLGQGKDYVYECKSEFVGLHTNDILLPSVLQQQNFRIKNISDILPQLYVLKINNFDKVAENTLEEWIYFLKNSEVKDEFRAKGLDKVKEKLHYENLSDEDKRFYQRSIENRRIAMGVELTKQQEAAFEKEQAEIRAREKGLQEGIEKGLQEGLQKGIEKGLQKGKEKAMFELVKNLIAIGLDNETIVKASNLNLEQIEDLRKEK